MSKAFYQKYRSKSLADVVGQRHITDILSKSLKEGKIAHAYLFTGPRGVGKTSVARILAHEINELPYKEGVEHLDIIEIDAASNNGVEDIRDLRERVQLAPVSAKKKVYIIDEVHMLSKAAFNALLKTLEEPPTHIVFILATTDADKLPDTIISRTQRFTFRTIPTTEVIEHLAWIAAQEGFSADNDALELIAMHGEGSFRDSISLLDQLHSAANQESGITKALVESFLGLPPTELIAMLIAAHLTNDMSTLISLLTEAERTGAQPISIANELIRTIRASAMANPELIPLLDRLLEVAGSSRPDIKLLTVMATQSQGAVPTTKPRTAALISKTPSVSMPATIQKKSPSPKKEAQPKDVVDIPAIPKVGVAVAQVAFDWDGMLKHIQTNYIAIFSVLSKCTPQVNSGILTLYTGNAFYKKKLDDIRYRTIIITSLETLGMSGLTIETVGTPPPPKDEVAASIAAIMGGGEEYTIEQAESVAS